MSEHGANLLLSILHQQPNTNHREAHDFALSFDDEFDENAQYESNQHESMENETNENEGHQFQMHGDERYVSEFIDEEDSDGIQISNEQQQQQYQQQYQQQERTNARSTHAPISTHGHYSSHQSSTITTNSNHHSMATETKVVVSPFHANHSNAQNIDLLHTRLEFLLEEGRKFHRMRKFTDALRCFNDAELLQPGNVQVLNARAKLFSDMGQRENALLNLSKALNYHPNCLATRTNRGILFNQMGNHADALHDFHAVLEIDGAFIPALGARGDLLYDLGEWAMALNDYEAILHDTPASHPLRSAIEIRIHELQGKIARNEPPKQSSRKSLPSTSSSPPSAKKSSRSSGSSHTDSRRLSSSSALSSSTSSNIGDATKQDKSSSGFLSSLRSSRRNSRKSTDALSPSSSSSSIVLDQRKDKGRLSAPALSAHEMESHKEDLQESKDLQEGKYLQESKDLHESKDLERDRGGDPEPPSSPVDSAPPDVLEGAAIKDYESLHPAIEVLSPDYSNSPQRSAEFDRKKTQEASEPSSPVARTKISDNAKGKSGERSSSFSLRFGSKSKAKSASKDKANSRKSLDATPIDLSSSAGGDIVSVSIDHVEERKLQRSKSGSFLRRLSIGSKDSLKSSTAHDLQSSPRANREATDDASGTGRKELYRTTSETRTATSIDKDEGGLSSNSEMPTHENPPARKKSFVGKMMRRMSMKE